MLLLLFCTKEFQRIETDFQLKVENKNILRRIISILPLHYFTNLKISSVMIDKRLTSKWNIKKKIESKSKFVQPTVIADSSASRRSWPAHSTTIYHLPKFLLHFCTVWSNQQQCNSSILRTQRYEHCWNLEELFFSKP